MLEKMGLTDQDIERAAADIGCEPNAVRAVAHVESAGSGFLPDGRPTILYEAHIFGRITKHAYPNAKDRRGLALSAREWDRNLYGEPGEYQYDRLVMAMEYDREAAQQACSWGAFQVMGVNWRYMNYDSVQTFVDGQSTPAGQLEAFVRFIKANRLQQALKNRHWMQFALRYNGPDYARNTYDTKMAAAYERFRKEKGGGSR